MRLEAMSAWCKRNLGIAAVTMLLVVSSVAIAAQTLEPAAAAGKAIVYDVATIKPNKTLSGSTDVDTNEATFKATNVSLKMLLEMGYGIRQDQISGLPGWAESTRYDIFAKVLDADPEALKKMKRPERRAMVRKLLEERFQIKSHIEVKTLPVFELTVLKEGIKFKQFAPAKSDDEGGDMSMNGQNHNMSMTARGVLMSDIASALSDQIQRTVLDRTGLPGKYDLQLKWLRDDAPAGGDDAAPPIYTALQDQLGLKLVAAKGPVNTLVIDSISLPTEN
jgi:uncharacterized protein (TIGR03435 family)